MKTEGANQVWINKGVNSDSGLTTLHPTDSWLEGIKINDSDLHDVFAETRVFKSDEEIEILKDCGRLSAEAHCEVMRQCRPGIRESGLASVFRAYCLENYNCKILPYSNICACGPNAATLHYVVNNDIIEENKMCLLDMGHAV